ncbi:PKD domain-containing protein [bacterium]|nr:PKD domain-containing protein [bacterium]
MPLKKVCLLYLLYFFSLNTKAQVNTPELPRESERQIGAFEFIRNDGQWHPLVKYRAEIPYGYAILENDAILYYLNSPEDYHRIHEAKHNHDELSEEELTMRKQAVRIRFPNVKYSPKFIEDKRQSHYYNYFYGNDQDRWASKIHPVHEVSYKNIYEGIDLNVDGSNGLKYEWRINQPTRELISQLYIEIEGADSIKLIDGNLAIYTIAGIIWEEQPKSFTYLSEQQTYHPLETEFRIEGNKVYYSFPDGYSVDHPIIIDPKLIFSTYSGSYGDNFGFTATYDSRGNLYAGGIVDAEFGGPYPVTSGSYDVTWNGGAGRSPVNLRSDISISKYDSSGQVLLWATYLGGRDDEHPHSLVVNKQDELIVFGTTYSDNFPTTAKAHKQQLSGNNTTDIILCKFSIDGSQLLASTYFGGERYDGFIPDGNQLRHNYADNFRGDVIIDDDNHVFVATCTLSDSIEIVGGIQSSKKNALDGLVFEMDENFTQVLWSTFLGGNGSDAMYSIKMALNDIYVGGASTSGDFIVTDSALGKDPIGGVDGVLINFDKQSKALKYSTYWGTDKYDQIYFIDRDDEGNIYATGQTAGDNKKSLGIYGDDDRGQFIFKIDSTFSEIKWLTTFGNTDNTPNLVPSAFLVDVCGHIYFSGWSVNSSAASQPGTDNMDLTSDAVQPETDNMDFYIMVLDKDASNLLYATYFGGDSTGDHVDGGTSRFDKRGVIYQSVCSSCPGANDIAKADAQITDFPVTPNAVFKRNLSVRCSNASFKIDLQIKTAVVAEFVAQPTVGCKPLGVQFTNRSVLGDTFFWDFGDGIESSELNPFHEYTEPGLYEVKLTVIDSNTCNVSDEYIRTVLVLDKGTADFEAGFQPCSDVLEIENKSEGAFSYYWDFGDGDTSSQTSPQHIYEESGVYTVSLIINAESFCADTAEQIVDVNLLGIAELYLYNAFSPNNDGINDCFRFEGLETQCEEFVWKVYNRWGEKVFETSDPYECWDGKTAFTDKHLPEGEYYYILDLNKNSISSQDVISGSITLFR